MLLSKTAAELFFLQSFVCSDENSQYVFYNESSNTQLIRCNAVQAHYCGISLKHVPACGARRPWKQVALRGQL